MKVDLTPDDITRAFDSFKTKISILEEQGESDLAVEYWQTADKFLKLLHVDS